MLIINGTVHTMDGLTIPNGYVAVSGDKIAKVGPMEEAPEHWEGETLDAAQGHVLPGYVDAHSHLGMFGDALGFEADDGNESTDPCTPHLRAIDAVNPLDRCFREARAAGVTTVLTGPGSANPISGQFVAVKTAGRWVDEMVLKAPVAMKLALGENPKCVYNERHETPVTRMATAAIIREQLYKAKRYQQDLERAQEDEDADPPDYDIKCEALLPVLRRQIKAHVHAHRADDICTALRLFREFQLDGVIIHGTEGYLVADAIRKAGVPVVCGPIITTRGKPELANACRENPLLLMEAGVPVSINTDANELPIDMLLASVAIRCHRRRPSSDGPRERRMAATPYLPSRPVRRNRF